MIRRNESRYRTQMADDADSVETQEGNPILAEIVSEVQNSRPGRIRCAEETRKSVSELLCTDGTKALAISKRTLP
jgi:hypothetical protein